MISVCNICTGPIHKRQTTIKPQKLLPSQKIKEFYSWKCYILPILVHFITIRSDHYLCPNNRLVSLFTIGTWNVVNVQLIFRGTWPHLPPFNTPLDISTIEAPSVQTATSLRAIGGIWTEWTRTFCNNNPQEKILHNSSWLIVSVVVVIRKARVIFSESRLSELNVMGRGWGLSHWG